MTGFLPDLNSERTQSPAPRGKSELGTSTASRRSRGRTLLLLLVAVDREGRPSALSQPLSEIVRGALRVDEDEYLARLGRNPFEVLLDEAVPESALVEFRTRPEIEPTARAFQTRYQRLQCTE
jgi:hypothetical protein